MKTKDVVVYFKKYVKSHPSAMLMSSSHFEMIKIEGAVGFEVSGEDGSKKPRMVSVGDRLTMDQAYEVSLESHVIIEPCYPN